MSIIDDMLILVEDEKKIYLEDAFTKMNKFKKQTISSSLGRLSAKGLINKNAQDKKIYYKINQSGTSFIDKQLEYIKYLNIKSYPENWNMIIFNIPEKQRKHRDELRRQLVNHGFGRLHDSLWFSKFDFAKQISEILIEMQIQKNVLFIKTDKLNTNDNKNIIDRLYWDWEKIEKNYNHFCKVSENFLDSSNKERFSAKQLVYQLSKIIKSDPKIDIQYFPKNIKKNKAIMLYNKIRPYCYN